MRTSRSTEIKVGVVSIVAIILAVVGIGLAKGWAVTGSAPPLSFIFPRSNGLNVTDPVTVNGVRRGQVTKVDNVSDGVLVVVALDRIDDLRSDARASITMLEITGGKKLEIEPGTAAAAIDPSQRLVGETAKDISQLIAVAGELSEVVIRVVDNLDTLTSSAKDIVTDTVFVGDIKQAAARANNLMAEMQDFVSGSRPELEATLEDARVLMAELRTAVEENAPVVDTLLVNLNELVVNADGTLADLDRTLAGADTLLADVSGLINDVKNTKGLVNKLVYDEALAERIDETMQALEKFVTHVRKYGLNTNVRLGSRP